MLQKTKKKNNGATQAFMISVFCLLVASILVVVYIAKLDMGSSASGKITKTAKVSDHLSYSHAIPYTDKLHGEEYYENLLFIGDSITYGIALYNYLPWDHVFAKVGLHQGTALNSKVVYLSKKDGYTIEEGVSMAKPGKIIITLGINAIYSCYNDSFIENYRSLIEKVKRASPESVIILQSIFPVSENWAKNNRPDCNQRIADANDAISNLAQRLNCYYLNTYEDMADENGFMLEGLASDGLHLSKKGYDVLFKYILTHTVESRGVFTKIGAIMPPASSNKGNTVSMPDITASSINPEYEYPYDDESGYEREGDGEDEGDENEGDEDEGNESEGTEHEGEDEDDTPYFETSHTTSERTVSYWTISQRSTSSKTQSETRSSVSSNTSSKNTSSKNTSSKNTSSKTTSSRRNPFSPFWR